MNQTRFSVGILLIILMAAGWCTVLGGQAAQSAQLNQAVELAVNYRERQLYAVSIQEYEKVVAQRPSKALYQELLDVYDLYYAQTGTAAVMRAFVAALSGACDAYPKEAAFWERYAQLYLDRADYTNAGKVLQKAQSRGASSQRLDAQMETAYYAFQVSYGSYSQILPGSWEGGYVVQSRDGWGMVTAKGETLLSQSYALMGPAGDSGQVLVTDGDGESWLLSAKGLRLAHYEKAVAQAGCWSEGLIPVQPEGEETWSYFSDDGRTVLSGYLAAGAFVDGEAAVLTAQGWQIIDVEGNPVRDGYWEDIRLDASGAFLQNSRILAKNGGSWRLYNSSWKEKEGFSCDDADLCLDGPIAFCRDGQWGFISTRGEEIIAPAYDQARSFSGGVAAVCKDGQWGFIDQEGSLVVDYRFADAGYFSPESGSCPVQLEENGPYQLIRWVMAR